MWDRPKTPQDMDPQLIPKIQKCHFLRDIMISFQWMTQIGLEWHQNFYFEKISKNKATSPILSFEWFWWEIHF